jgi:hypothetical protein
LIFIAAPHKNRVEFDLVEPSGNRGVNPAQHLRMEISAGDLGINCSIECIE